MHSAYRSGDIEALIDAYRQAPKQSAILGAAIPLLESQCPLGTFLELASRLNQRIAERGLHGGCREFLREAGI